MEIKYILNEILSEEELEVFLKLRYSCFDSSASRMFLNKNDSAVDINYYDRNSLHFGIYKIGQNRKIPVGYFRIILEERTMADSWVQQIAIRAGQTQATEHQPLSIFPGWSNNFLEPGLQREFCTNKNAGEVAGEVSRFFIIQEERSLKLSIQIIKSAFAIGLLHLHHAFICCFTEHTKAYMKFGFKQYPGSNIVSLNSQMRQKDGQLLYCNAGNLTQEIKKSFEIIQEELISQNCLVFNLKEQHSIIVPAFNISTFVLHG